MKRPPKRYIGFTIEPPRAARGEVKAELEEAWRRARGAGPSPARLLVCESGAGIVVVPRDRAADARAALERPAPAGARVRLRPVVTSGTIASVKARLHLGAPAGGGPL